MRVPASRWPAGAERRAPVRLPTLAGLSAFAAVLVLVMLGSPPPARAEPGGEYHEVARFGGFDESAFHGGPLTPGKFVEPTGFAVDSREGNDVYVADRTSSVEHTPANWRIQKLSATGTVLGKTEFTLPGGVEEPSMIAGLAVDHKKGQAGGRLYALLMTTAKAKAYRRHATQAQELLAWSTQPTTAGELVAASGLKKDPLGSTGGLISEAKQLEGGATPLYDPQGIVIDALEEAGVENPVVIEASNPRGLALNAKKEAIDTNASIEGVKLFEFEEHGETIVQQVAASSAGAQTIGATLKRWPPAGKEPGSQEARELAEQWGPLGIFDASEGSIAILLNGRRASVYPTEHTTTAELIRLNDKLEAPVVVNNAMEDPRQERRAIMGLDPGPFFTDPNLPPREEGRPPPFELNNAGPEVTQLEDGLYAADLRFEARPSVIEEEQEQGSLPIWLSYDEPEWRTRSPDKKINVGVRLLLPGSETQKLSSENGGNIVGTLGDGARGSPCNIASEEAALASGAGDTLWVLDKGPTPTLLHEGLGLRPGREIIELEPGASETSGCPQSSSEQFRVGQCTATQPVSAPLTVSQGSSVVFDASAVHLTQGQPFAYEWKIEYEGKPLTTEDHVLEQQQKHPVVEYTPEKAGTYTLGLTLWNDYGPHTLNSATVEVTSKETKPEAQFTYEALQGTYEPPGESSTATEQVAFKATGLSGTCSPDLYYRWTWGDGSREEDVTPETTHTYELEGGEGQSYPVSLEIVNSRYQTAKVIQTIRVRIPSAQPGAISLEPGLPQASANPLPAGHPSPSRASAGPTTVSPRAAFARGVLGVRVSCPAAKLSCTGTVQVETAAAFPRGSGAANKRPRVRLLLGTARFSLAGGASRALSIHLSARGAALLKTLRRLPVLIIVAAHDPLGDPGATTVHLTLATPRATGHRARSSR